MATEKLNGSWPQLRIKAAKQRLAFCECLVDQLAESLCRQTWQLPGGGGALAGGSDTPTLARESLEPQAKMGVPQGAAALDRPRAHEAAVNEATWVLGREARWSDLLGPTEETENLAALIDFKYR